MDPFSGSSKPFAYFEAGLDSERRFRKSTSVSTTASAVPLAPFDYPSPSVSSSESSPLASPVAPLDPPIDLGGLTISGPPSAAFDPSPASSAAKPVVKRRKDVYDLANIPTPYARTASSASILQRTRDVDPRTAEEQKWQEAMANGFNQVASGKVTIDLSEKYLTFVPVTITDLGNYIAVPSPFKQYQGLSRNYASPNRSPATSPRAAPATRTFNRVSSAPASTTAAHANLAALQERRRLEATDGAGFPASPSVASSSSTTTVRFSTATPPSSPMSTTASTTPPASLPSGSSRLLPGRPPSPNRTLGASRGVHRAVTFAPAPAAHPLPGQHRSPSLVPIHLILSNNQISKLPSQLFELKNLTFLTLRNNHLTSLPAAISALTNLEELNIGLNRITVLPSTILFMTHLTRFILHPNPWMKSPPSITSTATPRSSSTTSLSRQTPANHPIPSLYELCLRVLLSQRTDPHRGPPHLLPPPLATAYPDLLTVGAFASADNLRAYTTHEDPADAAFARAHGWAVHEGANIHPVDAPRVIACLRSAMPSKLKPPQRATIGGGASSSSSPKAAATAEELEDASDNPFYDPCPDPRLPAGLRRVFFAPKEERVVWLPVPGTVGSERFPVRFRGSTIGSLDFVDLLEKGDLDEDEPEHATEQGEQLPQPQVALESAADEDDEDGFDLDELDETPAF